MIDKVKAFKRVQDMPRKNATQVIHIFDQIRPVLVPIILIKIMLDHHQDLPSPLSGKKLGNFRS